VFLERQLELLRTFAVDVGHREADQRQAALADQRRRRRDQAACGFEDDVRRRRRPGHRVRPGRSAEIVKTQAQHHCSAGAAGLAHSPRDPVDEIDDDGVDLRR
jgi:hypothetical protein